MSGGDEELFAFLDDLEQQAEALYTHDRAAELRDREQAEYRQVPLAARLLASVGRPVELRVRGVGIQSGELLQVGAGWCRLRTGGGERVVVLEAVTGVGGASERAVPEVAWSPLHRLGLGSVLRRLVDAGERCALIDVDGVRTDAVPLRVGHDFVEVLAGRTPRTRRVLLPLAALAVIAGDQVASAS